LRIPHHYCAIETDADEQMIVWTPIEVLNVFRSAIDFGEVLAIFVSYKPLDASPIFDVDLTTAKYFPKTVTTSTLRAD
jgi:hypothetical protein